MCLIRNGRIDYHHRTIRTNQSGTRQPWRTDTGSYYLPRQYLGGAWDNGRDSEIVPRRNGNDADLVKFKITPAIRAAAAAAGQSLQGYILAAVYARMEREGQPLEIDPVESGEEGGL